MSETEDISMTPSSERSRSRSSSSVPSPSSTPSASPRKRSAYRDGSSQEKREDGYEEESMSTAATTPALTRTGSASAYTIPVSHRSSFSSKSEPGADTDSGGAVITPATPANVAVYAIEYVQGLLQERARKVLGVGRRRAKSSARDWVSTAEVVVLDLGDRGLDFVQMVLRLWIERPVFAVSSSCCC
ncbi:hypothetical protein BZA70DRAFT_274137 [Myxozyma melibiosi]|uniref:Uncharacterized protein n=1 Tax=Myxozyma melibiosi TaxID=54550 RepID=A0ABR1FFF7_9ASCO